jgi:outer membrane protein assembly factor BamB
MKYHFFLAAISITLSAQAADWPRFRGADGNGVAADAKPPITWSDSENVKWKLVLPGPGSSSPIVVGERVFVTCYSGYGDGSEGSMEKLQRHLLCIDRATGKVSWEQKVIAEVPEDPYQGFITEHGYASSTPAADGEQVYVFYGKTGVLAYDFTGKELWRVNVGKESGNRHWGSGSSLMLQGDKVIVNASEESQSIRALDKQTGKEIWKSESSVLELCYGTPALVPAGERTDLVLAVPGELWGMNPDTGKLRWFAGTGLKGNISPSVVFDGGMIYANGGFPGLGSVAVRGGGKGDVTTTNLVWETKDASYVPSPVLANGHLYVANDQGFALCLDAKDGKLIYRERLPGASAQGRSGKPFYASAVLANGLVYAVSRQNGTFIFEAKPEFKLVGQNKLAGDDSQFNATPALTDKQLFLRSNKYLYCLERK